MSGRRILGALGILVGLRLALSPSHAVASEPTEAALRALYGRFVAAQNALDVDRVRAVLWESPEFLWVSDGRPYWGPDALVERMKGFQTAGVWRVEPDLETARSVTLGPGLGYLSLTLTLVIGEKAAPDRLRFLVHMLGREGTSGWRIAALFTTEDKTRDGGG